jgi:hypothetical protein
VRQPAVGWGVCLVQEDFSVYEFHSRKAVMVGNGEGVGPNLNFAFVVTVKILPFYILYVERKRLCSYC